MSRKIVVSLHLIKIQNKKNVKSNKIKKRYLL